MIKFITATFLLTVNFIAVGQDKIEKKTSVIVDEGKLLYKSEMASWYGTDIFLDKYKDRRENIKGYFSYTDNNISKCIFFSKTDKVIGTISFDSTYNVNTAIVDGNEREFTTFEFDLFKIREKALEEINSDTLFRKFENTDMNLIPVIGKGEKKVFVLTGPQKGDEVIIGNDYLLTFDKKNNLIKKKRLHKNILPLKYMKEEDKAITMHTHLPETGEFITSTDICTLMLYEKFAKWTQHIVISEKYVCLWDCKKDQLLTLTKDVWEKIYKDQEKRHPDK